MIQPDLFKKTGSAYSIKNYDHFRELRAKNPNQFKNCNHFLIAGLMLENKIEYAGLKWPGIGDKNA